VHRLDDLGWAQFELVCEALLAAEGFGALAWSGRADKVRIAVAHEVPEALSLPPPVLVAIASATSRRVAGIPHTSDQHFGSLVLLTNDGSLDEALIRRWWPGADEVASGAIQILGPTRLESLLGRHPVVTRAVPSLLGVRDLSALTASESWDLAAACELARVFVPTRAYGSTLAVLERHHFAVLSGPPEMGKTAIARVLGLALQLEGWEVHECIRPEQIWAAYDRDRQQFFVTDDAFGSTEYRPDAAERWSLELPRLLQALDASHKLVWTSRPAPLRAALGRIHREHGVERFPKPAEVNVDAAALDVEERATILLRHARAALLERQAARLLRSRGLSIVAHPHFTPERIRRFVRDRLPEIAAMDASAWRLDQAIGREISEPTEAMAASFAALDPEHRALLVALVDSPPGPVRERDLAHAMRRHAGTGFPSRPSELVDRLADHFLRIVPPDRVAWVHPSWRDLVIEELAGNRDARRLFLERCSLEGALVALSRGGGRSGERRWPLLVTDGDWDRLAQRLHELAPELADPDVTRLLTALEDALRDSSAAERAEVAALTETALRALAAAWSTGRSYATEPLLDRVNALWEFLDLPPQNLEALVWAPPAGERYQGTADRHHAAPVPIAAWDKGSGDEEIVDRILADL